MSQGRNRVLLSGHYLIHGHCGQHLQPDCWTQRFNPLDCFTEQLVGLSVTQSITEKRRWRLSFTSFYPNNTLAQYITNLPRCISLSGDWECGLTEIHYPHDWYNIRNARLVVEQAGKLEMDVYFEDGYYGSAKTLVRALNDGVKGGSVKFSYDPVTQKVCVHMKGDTTFMLYGDLADILGFGMGTGFASRTTVTDRKTLTQGDSIVDLRRGFESLYVYSSIVEPRIVGDKIAPLLRIVPITGRHGEMVTARFDHVQYIPVLSREFGSIETEIRDDTGRPVPFERGKVTVTLHFRRCSSGLFR